MLSTNEFDRDQCTSGLDAAFNVTTGPANEFQSRLAAGALAAIFFSSGQSEANCTFV
jgi:hypothetical protein